MTTLSFACSLPGTGIRAIIPATAVCGAYAWPAGLSDEDILERLLTLNLALYLAEIGLDT